MPGAIVRYGSQNVAPTYAVVEAVLGGSLVEARPQASVTFNGVTTTINGIGNAASASTAVVGVATIDAAPPGFVAASTPAAVSGAPVISAAPVAAHTGAVRDCIVKVAFAAAATFGQRLQAGGPVTVNGVTYASVTPVTSATADPRTIVGRCEQPGGVGAGAIGLAYIL